jgi:predicted nucleotidyltransferase
MITSQLCHEIASRLQPMRPMKIIMFGSHARGEADFESDVDLVFISEENRFLSTFSERIHYKRQVLKYLRDIEMPIDLLYYTRAEWDAFLKINNALAAQIISEGVEIETKH